MTVKSVTLHLPEVVMQRAKYAAEALQRPLEEVLTTMLEAVLPDVEDAPPDMQADLARMTWLNDQELWDIARSTMPEEQQQQLRTLTELQAERPLTPEEQETLEMLRQEYGRSTLYKARAYALLSLRGGRPLLADN
jgi:primosomal protein N'